MFVFLCVCLLVFIGEADVIRMLGCCVATPKPVYEGSCNTNSIVLRLNIDVMNYCVWSSKYVVTVTLIDCLSSGLRCHFEFENTFPQLFLLSQQEAFWEI